MAAFKDAGHFWWQRCSECEMAWFVGDKPGDEDAEETCERCSAPALTPPTPEEVARDYETVREALALSVTANYHEVPSGCWATGPRTGDAVQDLLTCPGCAAIAAAKQLLDNPGALARLRVAAARVPGLEKKLEDMRLESVRADSWRDDARKNRERAERAEAERDAALSRESDLERQRDALHQENVANERAATAAESERAALRAKVAEMEREHARLKMATIDAQTYATEAVTERIAAERRVAELEIESGALRSEVAKRRIAAQSQRTPTPAPAGLMEAVESVLVGLERAGGDEATLRIRPMDPSLPRTEMTMGSGMVRKLRAAYDAARATPAPVGLLEAVGAATRAWERMGTAKTGDAAQAFMAMDMAMRALAAYDAAKGGETLDRTEVTLTLRQVREDAVGTTERRLGWQDSIDEAASRLGLTLDTPPSDEAKCPGCPHPPHLGDCPRRNGQSANPCPCLKVTPPSSPSGEPNPPESPDGSTGPMPTPDVPPLAQPDLLAREWHGCSDPMGHTFNEGRCVQPNCGMDLSNASHPEPAATCGATTTLHNGESVSPCDLPLGHNEQEDWLCGKAVLHKGWCLGSRFVWSADEPAAPEVVTKKDGVRVEKHPDTEDYTVSFSHAMGAHGALGVLARALAEAKRENARLREDVKRQIQVQRTIADAGRKAAEDMRERCAKAMENIVGNIGGGRAATLMRGLHVE